MRVISTDVLKNFAKKNPTAIPAAEFMIPVFERATWKNLVETRQYLSHADEVVVKSGKTITVFNLGGNNWCVITAIHIQPSDDVHFCCINTRGILPW
jgi:mRNA interferase HigB